MTKIKEYITSSLHHIYSKEELKSLTLIICRDILGLTTVDIYLCKDINLSENKTRLLKEVVERLKQHEPIQYILGYTVFCGLEFQVEPGVLIPRPETEELVALILAENTGNLHILDIGTGSGCIALTLAHKLPEATVEGWDISPVALSIAQRNKERLKADVIFRLTNILEEPVGQDKYHLIVSNPPYITEHEKADMDKNVLDWEPGQALFVPDNDPLLFYRHIAHFGISNLYPQGKLYLEINQSYGKETARMLESLNYKNIRVITDLFGNDRIVTACR